MLNYYVQKHLEVAIKKYINTTEVAELTDRPYNEILNLAKTGVLPSHKTHRGHFRLNVDAVEKYFGIQINKPAETEEKPVLEEQSSPVFESPQEEDYFSYVADEEHYTLIFKRMTEVKHSLKIATGNLDNFKVTVKSDSGAETLRICDFFLSLVERGVHVQVVCMYPFYFYMDAKNRCHQLFENPLFELRYNVHNHMKIFIFDDECAYFGSANITNAAIGKRTGRRRRNFEAGMMVWGPMMQAPMRHFEKSWNDPDILKHTWKRFATEAKELEKKYNWSYDK